MVSLLLAAVLASAPAAGPCPDPRLDPRLARELAAGEAEMLVVLREQADLAPAASLADRKQKGRFVFEALHAAARRTQTPILAWLSARGLPFRAFAIVNAIWVKGDAAAALALAARPEVLRVEANPLVRGIPPEPLQPRLAPLAVEPGVSQVNAPAVWAGGNHGEGIVVADADTGARWTHVALKPHYRGWNGATESHDGNWHDAIHTGGGVCGADSPVPCDDDGHGTHTTGFAVGDDGGTNQIGTAPGAKWIGCRNMDQGNGTPARYLECMEFFLAPYPVSGTPADGDPGLAPDIVNNSWGCPASEGCSVATLETALAAQKAAGILNVVSAGNSGPSCSTVSDTPAPSPHVFTVGALQTGTTAIAYFSSLGPVTADGSNRMKPDVVAPGTSIRSACPSATSCQDYAAGHDKDPDYGYSSGSGTSYSGPLTAGVAALVLSATPALMRQPDQVAAILTASATAIVTTSCSSPGGHPNNVFGWGLVNASAAVSLAALRPVLASVSPPSGPTAGGTTVTVAGANFAAGDTVTIGGTTVGTANVTATSLTFVTPPHAAAAVDVSVNDPTASESGTLTQGFGYCDGTNGCATVPLLFNTLVPCRLVDTRRAAGALGGPALAPNSQRTFRLEGTCAIPAGARVLVLNVTAVQPDAAGGLSLFPAGGPATVASVVTFAPGAIRAAFAMIPLDPVGRLTVRCDMAPGASRGTDLLLDVSGYFQ